MRDSEKWNWHENFPVISTYTDAQAVDDGVLVAVSDKDRVTRAVWDLLCSIAPVNTGDDGTEQAERETWALSESTHFLTLHDKRAREVYEKNIGGGIFSVDYSGKKMWIMPNENGGLTLLFPEDY